MGRDFLTIFLFLVIFLSFSDKKIIKKDRKKFSRKILERQKKILRKKLTRKI